MPRECAWTYCILTLKMRENRGVTGREVPDRGRGTYVIDVTGEIDLRKEPLNFKDIFIIHAIIVQAEKSFVKSNGYFVESLLYPTALIYDLTRTR